MVFGGTSAFEDAEESMGVLGSGDDDSLEVGLAYMEGTRAANKDAAGLHHLQGTKVELFVAAQGFV